MREKSVTLKPFFNVKNLCVIFFSKLQEKKSCSFTNCIYPGSGNKPLPSSYFRIKATTAFGVQWAGQAIHVNTCRNAYTNIEICAQIKLCFAYSHDKNYLYDPDAPKDLENPFPTELVAWTKEIQLTQST